jgi:hypothetical protein
MITFLIVVLTILFILGSLSPLFVTDDVRDVVALEQG